MSFTTSPSTAKLDAALAKAQGEFTAASKDKTNPAFRSKYADLAAYFEACRDALSKNGVSVTQWPVHVEGQQSRQHLITRLACEGEYQMAESSIPLSKADAHGTGGAITYLRRFALGAALGLAPDDADMEDDDGNRASAGVKDKHPPAQTKVQPQVRVQPQPQAKAEEHPQPADPDAPWRATQSDLDRLNALVRPGAWTKKVIAEYMTQRYGATKLSELTQDQYNELYITVREIDYSTAALQMKGAKEAAKMGDDAPLPGGFAGFEGMHA